MCSRPCENQQPRLVSGREEAKAGLWGARREREDTEGRPQRASLSAGDERRAKAATPSELTCRARGAKDAGETTPREGKRGGAREARAIR